MKMYLLDACYRITQSPRTRGVLSWIFVALVSFSVCNAAELPISLEDKVKAAYIYRLLNFVNWNDAASFRQHGAAINICVIGDAPVAEAIQLLHNKTVRGQTLSISRKNANSKLASCNIVFITRTEANNLDDLLSKIDSRVTLTISDIEKFADLGGLIELAIVEDKVRLIINEYKARRSKIHFSSKLMRIAELTGGNATNARSQ